MTRSLQSSSAPRRSTRKAQKAPNTGTVKTVSSPKRARNRQAPASARKTCPVRPPRAQISRNVGSTAASQKTTGMSTTDSDATNTSNHDRDNDNRDSDIVPRPDNPGK